jgi:hypothetical protein
MAAVSPSTTLQHVDAGAGAHLDPAFDLERDQRLAHRGAAHAELLRQIALGRQARADRELALRDQRAQLLGDLAVQALRGDGLQGHAGFSGLQGCPGLAKWSDQLILPQLRMPTHPAKPSNKDK